ncbi:MAG: hypothetical protein ACIAQZ_17005 [Sedimentisphaeraceae bacterium JB056]
MFEILMYIRRRHRYSPLQNKYMILIGLAIFVVYIPIFLKKAINHYGTLTDKQFTKTAFILNVIAVILGIAVASAVGYVAYGDLHKAGYL